MQKFSRSRQKKKSTKQETGVQNLTEAHKAQNVSSGSSKKLFPATCTRQKCVSRDAELPSY